MEYDNMSMIKMQLLPIFLVMTIQLNVAEKHWNERNDDGHDESVVDVVNFGIGWISSQLGVSKIYCGVIQLRNFFLK